MRTITEIVSGSGIFEARGVSCLKVTKMVGGKPVVEVLQIPIKSVSANEAVAIVGGEPLPPRRQEKGGIPYLDFTDASYIKSKTESLVNIGFARLSLGIDVVLKDKNGSIINDPKERIYALREAGLTKEHFEQLENDITALTKINDSEARDFFSKPSPDSPAGDSEKSSSEISTEG